VELREGRRLIEPVERLGTHDGIDAGVADRQLCDVASRPLDRRRPLTSLRKHLLREIAPDDLGPQDVVHPRGEDAGPAPDVEDALRSVLAQPAERDVLRRTVDERLQQRRVVHLRHAIEEPSDGR
jgi:hypothetical protein